MFGRERMTRRTMLASSGMLGLGFLSRPDDAYGSHARYADSKLSAAEWHRRRGTTPGPRTIAKFATVGAPPNGYGPIFNWDRTEKVVALTAFVNSADSLGVCVSNLKKGDILKVSSAAGICSTNDGSGNIIGSIIGGVATVAGIGFPEGAPFIAIGKEFADGAFKKGNNSDPRDAFGQDPTNGHWCQDEGGVLVCLPGAGGVYYATNGIKSKTPRYPEMYPDHVKNAFFLLRHRRERIADPLDDFGLGPIRDLSSKSLKDVPDNAVLSAPRTIDSDGEIFIVVWDSDFADNQGYYEVHMTIERP